MKKFITLIASVALAALLLLCGCIDFSSFGSDGSSGSDGRDGRDGEDGQDVSIYEIYDAAKQINGNENLTFDEFLKKYLNYTNEELDSLTGLQATINRSLMTGVSVLSRFASTSYGSTTYSVAMGSGIILWCDKTAGDAYVVTNCHVVYSDKTSAKFATDVRLYLYGQDTNGVNYACDTNGNVVGDENFAISAEIIAASVSYDIALLKVENSEVIRRNIKDEQLCTATFAESDDVYVGETVYAIGNASGEGVSAANGIISKDSEQIELSLSDVNKYDVNNYRVMRTTAAINHGNSGGGLFNSKGELVAIVNAKDDESDVDNMGYALPGSNVKRLLKLMYDEYVSNGNKMTSGGGIYRPLMGVTTTVSDSYATYNEVTGLAEITETVKIASVDNSPARGNLEVGDIIKNIKITDSTGKVKEEKEVKRTYHITDTLLSVREGDTVTLTVSRNSSDTAVVINFNKSTYFSYYE